MKCNKKKKKQKKESQLEVESKYRLEGHAELRRVRKWLLSNGFIYLRTCVITDTLLLTDLLDDTLRVRREQPVDGESAEVLWFRTRKTHLGLAAGEHVRKETNKDLTAKRVQKLVTDAIHTTGRALPSYSKRREEYRGVVGDRQMTVVLDVADGLSEFSGPYLEIEVILPLGSTEVGQVKREIAALARQILSGKRERQQSYRRMLIEVWSRNNG